LKLVDLYYLVGLYKVRSLARTPIDPNKPLVYLLTNERA